MKRNIILGALSLALLAGGSFAEGPCSVNGLVLDPTGSVVTGAAVELATADSQAVQTAQTSDSGVFRFSNIACGTYTVRARHPGFKMASQKVTAAPNAESHATFKLAISAASEQVGVSSAGEERPFRVDPTWNAWEEAWTPDAKPSFEPLETLRPNTDYALTLDLSAFSYGESRGLFSQNASADALKILKNAKGKVRLEVLVIPDPLSFDTQADSERHGFIDIDVGKIRSATRGSLKLKKEAFAMLKKKPEPSFEFGRFRAHIRTSSKVGEAGIAVSIWESGVPIDGFSIPLCVAADSGQSCTNDQVNSTSTNGNLIGALGAKFPTPDAALQFVEQDSSHLVGVFRCNSCRDAADQGFKTWPMKESVDGLVQYLSQTIVAEFNKAVEHEPATPDQDYLRSGESLYLEIFKDRTSGGVVPAAKAFNHFVQDSQLAAQPGGPTLFVRFLPARPGPLLLFPAGLMVLPGTSTPLAAKVRVMVPLENQIYTEPKKCIDRWSLMIPDPATDDSMSVAVNENFKTWTESFHAWKDHAFVYEGDAGLENFEKWISSDAAVDTPTALLLISHQKNNKVFFNDDSETPWIDSDHILREFSAPSLVVLGACGTAGPGQAEFVRQFNLRGVATVIGTSYEVDARMAGLFAAALMKNLGKNKADSTYTISNAVDDSMREVSNSARGAGQRVYGPRAFAFILAGNGQLRACVPPH
jgi:hypothetical protein